MIDYGIFEQNTVQVVIAGVVLRIHWSRLIEIHLCCGLLYWTDRIL